MSGPRWMQPPQFRPDPGPSFDAEPHLSWPWNLPAVDTIPPGLKEILRRNRGNGCQVAKYLFEHRKWRFDRATTSSKDIKDMVSRPGPLADQERTDCAFYFVSSLQDEATRSLGHWMGIPPTFFALPSVHLRVITGIRSENHLILSLQYMSKYSIGHEPSASLPHCRFRNKTGQQPHEWHANHARLVFLADSTHSNAKALPNGKSMCWLWRGLYMFGEGDESAATRLRDHMVARDKDDPDPAEVYQGLGHIIRDVIYNLCNIRTEFFDEAMEHLQVLSNRCLSEDLDPVKQLEYMRELYTLLPLWSQVRRQLNGTKNMVAQVSRHEMSSFEQGVRDNRYYVKRLSVVEDQLGRCDDAADKTKNLIDLIMGIASLQESRAAVRESRAANSFASSIQRVTILTFIYLPLTLASSILGMNITQVTGEATHSQLWLYFVIAIALMAATFGGWYVWSRLLPSVKCKVRQRALRRAATVKSVQQAP
ncbi:hypothetical protein C7974DRAFT_50939 [Boeremia exigua]|uniref:uncharacterized protein n=1 Tax=Boeremia exigua TaxID=749465 RepID=UPI001E8CDDBC|nr:uncharacterized protein C7974DRAFT_50939 [Boeremia exigua]KAH6616723.1 hypothetical protein C7974DRAFT_50939 [Boeremia exigua]